MERKNGREVGWLRKEGGGMEYIKNNRGKEK